MKKTAKERYWQRVNDFYLLGMAHNLVYEFFIGNESFMEPENWGGDKDVDAACAAQQLLVYELEKIERAFT